MNADDSAQPALEPRTKKSRKTKNDTDPEQEALKLEVSQLSKTHIQLTSSGDFDVKVPYSSCVISALISTSTSLSENPHMTVNVFSSVSALRDSKHYIVGFQFPSGRPLGPNNLTRLLTLNRAVLNGSKYFLRIGNDALYLNTCQLEDKVLFLAPSSALYVPVNPSSEDSILNVLNLVGYENLILREVRVLLRDALSMLNKAEMFPEKSSFTLDELLQASREDMIIRITEILADIGTLPAEKTFLISLMSVLAMGLEEKELLHLLPSVPLSNRALLMQRLGNKLPVASSSKYFRTKSTTDMLGTKKLCELNDDDLIILSDVTPSVDMWRNVTSNTSVLIADQHEVFFNTAKEGNKPHLQEKLVKLGKGNFWNALGSLLEVKTHKAKRETRFSDEEEVILPAEDIEDL